MAATFLLRLTDGTTTVNLGDGSTGYILDYAPAMGGPTAGKADKATERVRVMLLGGFAAARSTLDSMQGLLRQAANYQERRVGPRVWVERQLDTGDVWWRSEVLNGSVLAETATFDLQLTAGKPAVWIAWTRRAFWEGAEAELPLTNQNGNRILGGITAFSICDSQSGKDNFVDITGTDVAGEAPATIRVRYTNTYNNVNRCEDIYLALNWNSAPGSLTHILEGENAIGTTAAPESPSYGLYSEGKYGYYNVQPTETALYWTLNHAFLTNCAGNAFRVMARFASLPVAGIWVRPRVSLAGLTDLYSSSTVLLNTMLDLQDIGMVKIPPYGTSGTLQDLRLEMRMKRPAGAATIYLDYVQLMPLDGWRILAMQGYNIEYNGYAVDDGIDGMLYGVDAAGGAAGFITGYGEPILLEPRKNQRLYVIGRGSNLAQRKGRIRVWYRPRRVTL